MQILVLYSRKEKEIIVSVDGTQDYIGRDNHIDYAKAMMKSGSKLTQYTKIESSQSLSQCLYQATKIYFAFVKKKAQLFNHHVLDLVVSSMINYAGNI